LQLRPAEGTVSGMPLMPRTELFVSIVTMIVLEIYHLKWIWLSEWSCRKCGLKNIKCGCGNRKWSTYL